MSEWILIDRESKPGRNGVTMTRLTFQNIEDNEIAEMTLDNTYTNYKKSGWDHVAEDECPWGVYTDLRKTTRKTRTGVPVLTADSKANIIYRCENHEEALEMAQASIDMDRTPRPFDQLFTR